MRRVQAAVLADPCARHVVTLIDLGRPDDVEAYVRALLAFEPDLVGFSIYVWSTPCLIDVARELRRRRPGCVIVFGGPSARAEMFDLAPYRPAAEYLDAIVEGDGEAVFREIAALADLSREGLRSVAGVTTPWEGKWKKAPARPRAETLDGIPSPFQLDLMRPGHVAYLETYRGCPLSCRFCEWGASEGSKAVFSVDYIAREMDAFARLAAPAVFLLDAGLNLNARAFRNLREASRRTGFLKRTLLWAEIYPNVVGREHLDFLEEIGTAYLGVGMQSRDPAVLRMHQRPGDPARFEPGVRDLAAVTTIELQIIMGLPGDTPDGFRRTLDYALSLPASVRVYHCLVLPDALMTRGLPDWNIRFNPRDLAMTSCLGWSREALLAMREELGRRARRAGGKVGRYWWSFPRAQPGRTAPR